VKQTKHELETEHDEYEKKLRRINFALKKAEAAQPTQGGFFCAAARPPPAARPRPTSPPAARPRPASTASVLSAVRRPSSEHTSPDHQADDGLFEKTRSLAGGTSSALHKLPGDASALVDDKASPSAEVSARSARSQVAETERSEITAPENSKRTKGKGKGKSKRAPK